MSKIYAFADEASANFDKQIEAVLRNGLCGIEIRNVDDVNVSELTENKANEIKSKLDAAGIDVYSVGSPIGKISIEDDFEPHIDKFKHTLEIAEILGAENLRLFSFYIPNGAELSLYKDEVFKRLDKLLEVSKGSGITLCHENEKGIYGDMPERCLEIHKQFPEIKAIFDPANYVQCGADTLKAWEMLEKYVKYLHIKDALADGTVVPAGEGKGNVFEISKRYISLGGEYFTVEPHLTIFGGLEKLERKIFGSKADFRYKDADTAFDAACGSFKKIMKEGGCSVT